MRIMKEINKKRTSKKNKIYSKKIQINHRAFAAVGILMVIATQQVVGLSNPAPFLTTEYDHGIQGGSIGVAKCLFHDTIESQRISTYSASSGGVASYKAYIWQSGMTTPLSYTSPAYYKILKLDQILNTNYYVLTLNSLKIDILEYSTSPAALGFHKQVCISPPGSLNPAMGEFTDTYHHTGTNWIIGGTSGGYLFKIDYTVAGCSSATYQLLGSGKIPVFMAYYDSTQAFIYYVFPSRVCRYQVMPSFAAIPTTTAADGLCWNAHQDMTYKMTIKAVPESGHVIGMYPPELSTTIYYYQIAENSKDSKTFFNYYGHHIISRTLPGTSDILFGFKKVTSGATLTGFTPLFVRVSNGQYHEIAGNIPPTLVSDPEICGSSNRKELNVVMVPASSTDNLKEYRLDKNPALVCDDKCEICSNDTELPFDFCLLCKKGKFYTTNDKAKRGHCRDDCASSKLFPYEDFSDTCVNVCPKKFGRSGTKGRKCDKRCANINCKECSDNYLHCGSCNSGTTCNDSFDCSWDPGCQTCPSTGPNTFCSTCNAGFTRRELSTGKFFCVPDADGCPPNNFGAGCSPCDAVCLGCTASGTTSCKACRDMTQKFTITGASTTCTTLTSSDTYPCGTSKYLDAMNECVACDANCYHCKGKADFCTSCQDAPGKKYFNTNTNTCISTCPDGTYGKYMGSIDLGHVCTACESTCKTCDEGTSSDCLSCDSATRLYRTSTKTCILKSGGCPEGEYETSGNCEPCPPAKNCKACVPSGASADCSTCNGSDLISLGACVNQCPTNSMQQGSNCLPCTSPCASCSGTQTTCDSCISTHKKEGNTCVTTCSSGFYESGSNCLACTSPCATCTGAATTCDTCIGGYKKQGTTCVTTCSSGYFESGINCLPCTSPCASCTGSATTCDSCISTHKKEGNSCVTTCSTGFYENGSNCLACTSPCASCTGAATTCDTCIGGHKKEGTTCVTSCSTGFYESGSNCLQCTSPCATCTGAATTCDSCISTHKKEGNTCVTTCSSGFYESGSNCLACTSPCATCTGAATTCDTCIGGYKKQGTACLSSCTSGFYESGNTCYPCTSPCATCSGSATNCGSCIGSHKKEGNSCVTTCSGGFFESGSNCLPCTSPCATCSGAATTCSSCIATHKKEGNTCVTQCSSGFFESGSDCLPCTSPCTTCTGSATTCDTCIGSHKKQGSSCVTSCSTGFFESGSNCLPCTGDCSTCFGSATFCTGCNGGKYLLNGACVVSCGGLDYVEINGVCEPCLSPCTTCTGSQTNCASCSGGKLVKNGACVDSCGDGYYQSGSSCLSCQAPCSSCNGSPTTCTSCGTSKYLSGSSCVSTCPKKTYADQATNKCLPCSLNCLECTERADKCTSCEETVYWLNTTHNCQRKCSGSQEYWVSPNNCQACIGCSKCLNITGTCPEGLYYMLTSPVEFYENVDISIPMQVFDKEMNLMDLRVIQNQYQINEKCLSFGIKDTDIEITSKLEWRGDLRRYDLVGNFSEKLKEGNYTIISKVIDTFATSEKNAIGIKPFGDNPNFIVEYEENPMKDDEVKKLIKRARVDGERVGNALGTAASMSDALTFTSVFVGPSWPASFVHFTQSGRLIARLRMIGANFGVIYEVFLEMVGTAFNDYEATVDYSKTDSSKDTKRQSLRRKGGQKRILGWEEDKTINSRINENSKLAAKYLLGRSPSLLEEKQLNKNQISIKRILQKFKNKDGNKDYLDYQTQGKLSENNVILFMTNNISNLIKLSAYLISWALKLLFQYMMEEMARKKEISLGKMKLIWYHRRAHLILFNLLMVDLFYFGTRGIFNSRISVQTIAKISLVFFCYVLMLVDFMGVLSLAYDIYHRAKEAKKEKLKSENQKRNKRVLNSREYIDRRRRKKRGRRHQPDSELDFGSSKFYMREPEDEKEKEEEEEKKEDQRSVTEQKKSKIEKKTADEVYKLDLKEKELNDLGYNKEIDQKKTIEQNVIDQALKGYLLAEVRPDNRIEAEALFLVLLQKPIFMVRVMVYHISLSSLSNHAVFLVIFYLFVEIGYMIFMVFSFSACWRVCSRIMIVQKLLQSVMLIFFHVITFRIIIKSWSEGRKVDVHIQSMGIYLVLILLASEVVFLVVNVFLGLIVMIYKKVKKIKPKHRETTCLIYVWVKEIKIKNQRIDENIENENGKKKRKNSGILAQKKRKSKKDKTQKEKEKRRSNHHHGKHHHSKHHHKKKRENEKRHRKHKKNKKEKQHQENVRKTSLADAWDFRRQIEEDGAQCESKAPQQVSIGCFTQFQKSSCRDKLSKKSKKGPNNNKLRKLRGVYPRPWLGVDKPNIQPTSKTKLQEDGDDDFGFYF